MLPPQFLFLLLSLLLLLRPLGKDPQSLRIHPEITSRSRRPVQRQPVVDGAVLQRARRPIHGQQLRQPVNPALSQRPNGPHPHPCPAHNSNKSQRKLRRRFDLLLLPILASAYQPRCLVKLRWGKILVGEHKTISPQKVRSRCQTILVGNRRRQ